ncbi:MAG TPA: type II toxin-antitoxin system RelE/ParE family toxin [Longimicrobium sp.]|nr:type II toxin-antitoxin system RelE/ParE family toxin [Longimicrobium sp.]
MKRGYWFHAGARTEFGRAVEFYRKESTKLAEAFYLDVMASIEALRERPLLGAPAQAGTRCKQLDRFPYTLFYRDKEDEIQIFAVAHHRRRPGYWLKRLK